MIYYGHNDYRDYLAHHGILGQRWGKRNGPPYPLSAGAHSASEKKAGWKNSLNRTTYSGADKKTKPKKNSNKSELALWMMKLGVDVLSLNPVGLTLDIIRGGEAAVASIKERNNKKRREGLKTDPKTGLKLKASETTPEEDMKRINPSVYDFDTNTKNNCMLCTTAYELNRRGYDVSAGKTTKGFTANTVKEWFPKAEVKDAYNPPAFSEEWKKSRQRASWGINKELSEQTINELKKQPNGARGNIMVTFATMGGHSMVYEVNDGNVIIRDCQINQTYKKPEKILNSCATVQYARTDNVDFDIEKIKEIVR